MSRSGPAPSSAAATSVVETSTPRGSFSCRHVDQMLVIALSGRLTRESGADLLEWLSTAPLGTPRNVVVNLGNLTALDPEGAEALLDAYVATTLRGGILVVTNATEPRKRSLQKNGVCPLIETFADDAAAIATLRSRAQLAASTAPSSLADVVMMAHPANLNSFEFIRIAALRAAQLIQGCAPLVPNGAKPATTAMHEVAAGKVRASPRETVEGAFRQATRREQP